MQKTLGGDRLGSGNKLKVHLHGYGRSTHDLGYLWRSTMSPGTLIPFLSLPVLPGDTFDIHLECDIKTHPTIGPLFGSFKTQLDIFQAPIRLYNSWLHNNAINIGRKMSDIKLPIYELRPSQMPLDADMEGFDLDNAQINPSSLLKYLGLSGIGFIQTPFVAGMERTFNAIPHCAYWEIYKNYYANKQEEIGAFIHTQFPALVTTVDDPPGIDIDGNNLTPAGTFAANWFDFVSNSSFILTWTGATPIPAQIFINTTLGLKSLEDLFLNITIDVATTTIRGYYNWVKYGNIRYNGWDYQSANQSIPTGPNVVTFPLEWIDQQRNDILASPGNVPYDINQSGHFPWSGYLGINNGFPSYLASQEGLALKTYQSDIFNNWINTDWIDDPVDGITALTAIDTSAGSFTVDQLILSRKVYDMLNRIAISGGTYDDYLDAVYDHDRYKRAESPMYEGGLIKELVFQEVISNSNASSTNDDGGQPLGTLAGKGVMSRKHKGGHIVVKVDEPSYIIGIVSLTPRIDYSQGNAWDVHLQTIADLHVPALDGIGFQELTTEQMAWFSTDWNGTNWVTYSAGKQPAWLNYMTNYNKTFGNFAINTNEMFMTLNRRYEYDGGATGNIGDVTTYIDPAKFNFIFAQTALDAQNFWCQIAIDITARRKMSGKVMPNL